MSRLLKQTITFLTLLLLVSILELPFGSYKETLLPKIQNIAKNNNLTLNSKDLLISFPLKMVFEDASLTIPVNRLPVSFFLNSVMLKIRPAYLLLLQTKGRFSVNAYLGALNGEFKKGFFSDKTVISAEASNFKLQEYPLFKNLNIKGNLNFNLNLTTDHNLPISGDLKLDLSEGSYESEFIKIVILKIPYTTNIVLNVLANYNENILSINRLNLSCSQGEVSGSTRIKFSPEMKLEAISSTAIIKLTEEGKKNFSGYLALAAKMPLEKAGNNWEITFEQKDNKQNLFVKSKDQ